MLFSQFLLHNKLTTDVTFILYTLFCYYHFYHYICHTDLVVFPSAALGYLQGGGSEQEAAITHLCGASQATTEEQVMVSDRIVM